MKLRECVRGAIRYRQPELGLRTEIQPALQTERAAGLIGKSMHHGQAETGALAGSLGREEWFDRSGERRRVHAIAVVLDRESDISAWRQRQIAPCCHQLMVQ